MQPSSWHVVCQTERSMYLNDYLLSNTYRVVADRIRDEFRSPDEHRSIATSREERDRMMRVFRDNHLVESEEEVRLAHLAFCNPEVDECVKKMLDLKAPPEDPVCLQGAGHAREAFVKLSFADVEKLKKLIDMLVANDASNETFKQAIVQARREQKEELRTAEQRERNAKLQKWRNMKTQQRPAVQIVETMTLNEWEKAGMPVSAEDVYRVPPELILEQYGMVESIYNAAEGIIIDFPADANNKTKLLRSCMMLCDNKPSFFGRIVKSMKHDSFIMSKKNAKLFSDCPRNVLIVDLVKNNTEAPESEPNSD